MACSLPIGFVRVLRFAQERNDLPPTIAHIVVVVENLATYGQVMRFYLYVNDRIDNNSQQGVRLHPLIGLVTVIA